MLTLLVVALLALPAVGWADRRFLVRTWGDECSGACEFRLCLERDGKTKLRPCSDVDVPDVVVRQMYDPPVRLQLRGATARLSCYVPGAACDFTPPCQSDADCPPGLACPPHLKTCALTTTCPGPGYVPGAALSDKKKEGVIAYSDPCSGLCEFRLCLVDEKLVPCTEPGIIVRAPFLTPMAPFHEGPPRLPRFVLKHGRRQSLPLTCFPVGAPCWPCDTAEDCFTGGACVDGSCRTTALCQ